MKRGTIGLALVAIVSFAGASLAQQSGAEAPPRANEAAGGAVADDKRLLNEALRSRDWGKALPIAKRLAEVDDAEAQGVLGIIYYDGLSVAQDREQAILWLEKAVARGFRSAEALLGRAYFEVERYQAAEPLLARSAASGNSVSMLLLSSLYGNGLGVKGDPSKSMHWLVKAGPRNQSARDTIATLFPVARPGAAFNDKERRRYRGFFEEARLSAESEDLLAMGAFFETGDQADIDAAIQWYFVAARQGDAQGEYKFAQSILRLRAEGGALAQEHSNVDSATDNQTSQLDDDARLLQIALNSLHAAGVEGHIPALIALARTHIRDSKLPPDVMQARVWWGLAAARVRDAGLESDTDYRNELNRLRTTIEKVATDIGVPLASADARVRDHVSAGSWPEATLVTPTSADTRSSASANAQRTLPRAINLRSGPGTNNTLLTTLRSGSTVVILQRQADWARVRAEQGLEGWLLATLLGEPPVAAVSQKPRAPTAVAQSPGAPNQWMVDVPVVNVRTAPDLAAPIAFKLYAGQLVQRGELRGDWMLARVASEPPRSGWVFRELLTRMSASDVSVAARERWVVNVRSVNVRAGPGTEHAVVAGLVLGTALAALEARGEWLQVAPLRRPDAALGWIRQDLLQRHSSSVETGNATTDRPTSTSGAGRSWLVAADSANVRAGPSVSSETLYWVRGGARLMELERQGDWVKVDMADGRGRGWVYARVLEAER